MSGKAMSLERVSKLLHAARLVVNGTVSSQHEAGEKLGITRGRISDAYALLTKGIPELIAAVESGELPMLVGAELARQIPTAEQLAFLERFRKTGKHGLFIGKKGKQRVYQGERAHAREQREQRELKNLDNLIVGLDARVVGLEHVLGFLKTVRPEPEQGRFWRLTLRKLRRTLTELEKHIDWSKVTNTIGEEEHGESN